MTFADVVVENSSVTFNSRQKILIVAFWLAGIILGIIFFVGLYNSFEDTTNYLPPNCYSLNGKQICPNP